jgi:hypothetical protein
VPGTSVRSSSIGTATTGTAESVAAPAGTTTGDLVIVIGHLNIGGGGTIADNNGATPFTRDLANLNGGSQVVCVFSRRIQAGDPTTYHFTGNNSDRWTLVAVCYQNPDPSTIYDVAPSVGNSTVDTGTNPGSSAPSITTSFGNSIVVAAGMPDGSLTGITGPAGFTSEQNGGNQAIGYFDKLQAAPGASGAAAFTWGASNPSVCVSFAIKNSVLPSASFWPLFSQARPARNVLLRM